MYKLKQKAKKIKCLGWHPMHKMYL